MSQLCFLCDVKKCYKLLHSLLLLCLRRLLARCVVNLMLFAYQMLLTNLNWTDFTIRALCVSAVSIHHHHCVIIIIIVASLIKFIFCLSNHV